MFSFFHFLPHFKIFLVEMTNWHTLLISIFLTIHLLPYRKTPFKFYEPNLSSYLLVTSCIKGWTVYIIHESKLFRNFHIYYLYNFSLHFIKQRPCLIYHFFSYTSNNCCAYNRYLSDEHTGLQVTACIWFPYFWWIQVIIVLFIGDESASCIPSSEVA